MIWTKHQILFRWPNRGRDGRGM